MLYMPISTTIVNIETLRKTRVTLADENETIPANLSYAMLKMQVRKITDEFLKEKGILNEKSDLFKAGLAWYVLNE